MKITNVTLKLLVLNNKEGYFCPMEMCIFANLDLHVFCWSKLTNPILQVEYVKHSAFVNHEDYIGMC